MSASNHKSFLPELYTAAVILLMVAASELLQDREILFPEIAALATGNLLAPRRTWRVSPARMILFISVGAMLGLGIVVLVPIPLWQQFVLAFAVSQLLYLYSGTTLAPMVSAVVLPVVLQTRSIIYPVSAAILTTLIVLLRLLLEHGKTRPVEDFLPVPPPKCAVRDNVQLTGRSTLTDATIRIFLVALLAYPAIRFGRILVVAPPLLVAFTEFCNPEAGARRKPVKAVLFLTICAVIGSLSRLLLCETLHLPLIPAAAVAVVLFLLMVRLFGLYLPPAGAATLLAFLVPAAQLPTYALQILIGGAAFMAISIACFREKRHTT